MRTEEYLVEMWRQSWVRESSGTYVGFTITKTKSYHAESVIEQTSEFIYQRADGIVQDGEPVKVEVEHNAANHVLDRGGLAHVLVWSHRIPDGFNTRLRFYAESDGVRDEDDLGFTIRGPNMGMGKHEVKYVGWASGLQKLRDNHSGKLIVRLSTWVGSPRQREPKRRRYLYFCTKSEQELFEKFVALEVMET